MSARDPQPLPAGVEVEMLDAVWQLARTPAGACTDPATLAAATGILILVALLAGAIPGSRATRVEPVQALRYE